MPVERVMRTRMKGALLALGVLLGNPANALAHPFLRRSSPGASDTVAAGPAVLRLVFSEPIELRFTQVELVGPGGSLGYLAGISVVPDSLGIVTAPVGRVLPAGNYVVRWQAAGDDGHVVRGEYGFVVSGTPGAGEAAGNVVPPGSDSLHKIRHPGTAPVDTAFDASSPLFVALRWLMYLGLLGIIGAIVFQSVVLSLARRRGGAASRLLADDLQPRVARFGLAAAVVFLVSVPGRLFAQSLSMHGAGAALDSGLIFGMIAHTMWGWSWLAQVVLGLGTYAGFRRVVRGRGGWGFARAGALLLAFTPAFAGHAIAAERWIPFAVLSDGIHILGASGWLGTLAVLLFVGLAGALRLPEPERGPVSADLVNAFSPVALGFAGAAAVTGAFSTLVHTGRIADLWQTAYGLVLLLKLGVLSVVAATGAFNWRKVRPVMGDELAARRIGRSATVELLVAVVVLVVTAVLVALPTPLAARAP